MSIESIQENDIDSISSIFATSWRASYRDGQLSQFFKQPSIHGLKAISEQRVLGVLIYSQTCDEIDIIDVVVLMQMRRNGIGRALISKLINTAARESVGRIVLDVGDENVAAISLYSNLGFNPVGKRDSYYSTGEAAIVMERRIGVGD